MSRFNISKGKRVADFGCGPGLYTWRLAKSGAQVVGIDFSKRSIQYAREYAKQQDLSIEYVHDNYLNFKDTQQFDLLTMIMCDFCALSPKQRAITLDKYKAHLHPGGALLFDVYSLCAFAAKKEIATYSPNQLDGFWSCEHYFGFMNTFKYEDKKVTLDKYTIVQSDRTHVVYNWLQYFDCSGLKTEIEAHGLVFEEFLGDVAGAKFDPIVPNPDLKTQRCCHDSLWTKSPLHRLYGRHVLLAHHQPVEAYQNLYGG